MPNSNGTGPQGQRAMTGRRRERGRERVSIQEVKPQGQSQQKAETFLGVGRGGRLRGSGQGNCYGGNKRTGQGKRFGNKAVY